jgi:hypothetical protein
MITLNQSQNGLLILRLLNSHLGQYPSLNPFMPHSEQVKRTTAVMFFDKAMRPDVVFGAALLNTHSLRRGRLASRLKT